MLLQTPLFSRWSLPLSSLPQKGIDGVKKQDDENVTIEHLYLFLLSSSVFPVAVRLPQLLKLRVDHVTEHRPVENKTILEVYK